MILGGILFFIQPNDPESASFLTSSDKGLATARGRDGEDEGNKGHFSIDVYLIKESLKDPRLWLMSTAFFFVWTAFTGLIYVAPEVAASSFELSPVELANLNNTALDDVLSSLEDGSLSAVILATLPVIFGAFVSIPICLHSDTTGERAYPICISLGLAALGFLFLGVVPPAFQGGGPARYFSGLFTACCGLLTALPLLLAYAMDGKIGETHRCLYSGFLFLFGQSFHLIFIFSPFLFPIKEEPTYPTGSLTLAGLCLLGALFVSINLYMNQFAEMTLWGKPAGLRRLMNDAEESSAWSSYTMQRFPAKTAVVNDESFTNLN